jgi:hypothetical protein
VLLDLGTRLNQQPQRRTPAQALQRVDVHKDAKQSNSRFINGERRQGEFVLPNDCSFSVFYSSYYCLITIESKQALQRIPCLCKCRVHPHDARCGSNLQVQDVVRASYPRHDLN